MKREFIEELEKGLDYYDPENRVFPKIAQKAEAGQPLNEQDVLVILKWKTNRLLASYSKTVTRGTMKEINKAIADASKPTCEIAALNTLVNSNIHGIKLAVATAILTVCYPDKFTIIDARVLELLDLFPSRLPKNKRTEYDTSHWTPPDYIYEFLPKVRECSERWGCSLRNADRALWGLSISKQGEKIIANAN
jgi:hypothetical protein